MFWQGVYNKDVLMSDWNLLEGFQTQGQVYGQAYENICHRILGEEVAFLDLDAKQGVFSKLKDLFKKNLGGTVMGLMDLFKKKSSGDVAKDRFKTFAGD